MNTKLTSVVFVFLLYSFSVHAQKKLKDLFKKEGGFFSTYVDSGRVDYPSLRKDPQIVNTLVKEISAFDLSGVSKKKAKAFYINAYNIFLIHHIVAKYPAFSPLEEKGLFSEKSFIINGEPKTLNELEKLMFERFKDFRVYTVLSSGTVGCPSVANFAFLPGKLNRQLKRSVKVVVNDPEFIRVKNKSSLILLCENFKPWRNFFDEKAMIKYINKFRKEDLPSNFSLRFYPGKRSLNVKAY